MSEIFIDLETIPSQLAWIKDQLIDEVRPPGTIKKPESIKAWMEEHAEAAVEEQWLKTSFDGSLGEICTIGFAIDDEPALSLQRTNLITEKDVIQDFFDILEEIARLDHKEAKYLNLKWVGHNSIAFDLRFLYKRCVINSINTHGIKIPVDARHGSQDSFDTLIAWQGFNAKCGGSMEQICKVLGIPGKNGFDGSMVWGAYKAGEYEKIAEYCRDDVERTRQMYKRMIFQS